MANSPENQERPEPDGHAFTEDVLNQVREQMLKAAGRREQLMNALNNLATTFLSQLDIPFADIMDAGVELIVSALDIDRLTVWRNFKKPDGLHASQIYRWDKDSGGATKAISVFADKPYADFVPGWEKLLANGNTVNGPTRLLPEREAELLRAYGIASVFVVPVFMGNDFWGFVVFGTTRDERYFDDESAEMMNSAAFLFANAIMQNEMQRRVDEAEEYVNLMLDACPMSCQLWDDKINCIDCNNAAVKLFGLKSKREYIDNFYNLSPEFQPDGKSTRESAVNYVRTALTEGGCTFEWMHQTLDGMPIPVETTLVRLKYKDNYVIAGYTWDLRKIREAEKRVHLMFDSSPICAQLWDENYNVIDCNEAAVKLYGFQRKQDFLDNFFKLSPELQPDGIPSAEKALICVKRAFAEGRCEFEWMHQHIDGMPMPAKITLVRVEYRGGYVVVGYTSDLREYKKMLNEINDTMFEVHRANRVKSEFLAKMSHEMRTPLNAVIGMATVAKNAKDDDKRKYALNKIEDAAAHLLGVINDILDMSNIEANKLELKRTRFDLDKLLQKAVSFVQFRIDEKHLSFFMNIDGNMPKSFIGDEQRLTQILTNLLSNAAIFTPDHGEIGLHGSFLGEQNGVCELRFAVYDTGIGISEEQQIRIFRAFEQAETGTNRRFGGTGLGLPISKRFIEMMGGKITIDSQLGHGSTFTFTVKLAAALDNLDETPDEFFDHNGVFSGKRILLAEDIEINRRILIALLDGTGLEIDMAENGRQALDMITEAPCKYDLVFMDMQMPEMDGLEATRRIRTMPYYGKEKLPIVAMTANVFQEDIDNCIAAGMNDHIGKPLDINIVFEKLHQYL